MYAIAHRWNAALSLRCVFCLIFLLWFPTRADAHVKWFAEFNLVCPPRSPSEIIFGDYFLLFCLFTAPLMFAVAYADRHPIINRNRLARVSADLTDQVEPYFPMALRLGVSAFFSAAAAYGGFLITPDLKTEAGWVPYVHVAIAGVALLPHAAFLAGFGIIALYGYAMTQFGLYHLLDYPIFLGVAAHLIIVSLFGPQQAVAAHNVMRWATGITLLWAGIEKFAYPEWSFDLLDAQPALTFGFASDFYMVSAGFVEFCCAFLLITGMLSARIAALILQFFFLSAIYYFGVIDAIGHSGIIVVLSILILSHNPAASLFEFGGRARTALIHTIFYFVLLYLFIVIYFNAHYLSYRPDIMAGHCGM